MYETILEKLKEDIKNIFEENGFNVDEVEIYDYEKEKRIQIEAHSRAEEIKLTVGLGEEPKLWLDYHFVGTPDEALTLLADLRDMLEKINKYLE